MKKRRPQQMGRMAQVEEQVYTKDRPPPIEGQLISVQAHIEDLEVKHILNLQGLPASKNISNGIKRYIFFVNMYIYFRL